MTDLANGFVTDTTTPEDVKAFWPDYQSFFPPTFTSEQIDIALGFFIKRAEILINLAGQYDSSNLLFQDIMELAANLLVRRLVYADMHPAASAEPAGVRSESAKGVSYSMFSEPRSLQQLLGDEVAAYLQNVLNPQTVTDSTSIQVFDAPVLSWSDEFGSVELFDPILDDSIRPQRSEIFRIRRTPFLNLPGRLANTSTDE